MSRRVAVAYAGALFDLAAETGSAGAVGEELKAVAGGLAADAEVAEFLTSRQTGAAAKRRVLDRVLSGNVDERLRVLLLLLASRGRLGSLMDISGEYDRRAEAARGVRRVKVTSASALDEAERERVAGSLSNRLGRKVLLEAAGSLRLDLAAYRELEAFAQMGTELDETSQTQLTRGARLVEVLKQSQYSPFPVEEQVVVLFAATRGYLDDVPISRVRKFETALLAFMRDKHADLLMGIRNLGTLPEGDILPRAVAEFKAAFKAGL